MMIGVCMICDYCFCVVRAHNTLIAPIDSPWGKKKMKKKFLEKKTHFFFKHENVLLNRKTKEGIIILTFVFEHTLEFYCT